MKKILILTLVTVLLFSLISCSRECTVTFTVDGVVTSEQTIKKGETVTPPKAPEKDGYTFLGWTLGGTDFDFSTPIKSDITLEAKLIDDATLEWGDGLAYTLSEDGTYYSVSGIGGWKTTEVVIPDTYAGLPVTAVLGRALFGNERITSISLPASITFIGDRAFSDCSSLTAFSVAEDNTCFTVQNGDLYSKDGTVLVQYAIGRGETTLTIGEGVKKIGAGALSHSKLTTLSLPASLEEFGAYSCYGCGALTTVSFPSDSSLSLIGEGAFSSCSALAEITLPKSIKTLGQFAFYSCKNLTKVKFEGSSCLSEVDEYAFELCSLLKEFHYDGSREKWKAMVNVANNNDHLKTVKFASIGCYTAPEEAWVPTEDYAGITYAVWASESDYLAGLAPAMWYDTATISREGFGATDDYGTTYENEEFIPGYIHLFCDMETVSDQQLIVGGAQKLVLNLGGNTLITKKGFRIGGNHAYHPDASLTVKNGTLEVQAGQIQPRYCSTLIFDNTIFISSSNDVFYGLQAKLLLFTNSEAIIKTGADFRLAPNIAKSGEEYVGDEDLTISFVNSDLIYLTAPVTAVFEIYASASTDARWNIHFDKDSAVIGNIQNYIMLFEALGAEGPAPLNVTQNITYSEGTSFFKGATPPSGYLFIPVDPETGNSLAPEPFEGSDERVCITVTE